MLDYLHDAAVLDHVPIHLQFERSIDRWLERESPDLATNKPISRWKARAQDVLHCTSLCVLDGRLIRVHARTRHDISAVRLYVPERLPTLADRCDAISLNTVHATETFNNDIMR